MFTRFVALASILHPKGWPAVTLKPHRTAAVAAANEHGQEDIFRWTWSYDEDVELDKRREHPAIAWLWRLETCDPSERPALLAKSEERDRLQEEKHRHAKGWEHLIYDSFLDLDQVGQTVMQMATPEAMALRIELGLPAEPEKVPTEEERILTEVGDGYMTPAQRKRLRYLRKHPEKG